MIKQALALWKTERTHKGTTLQHRLILFFACVTVCLVLGFALLLLLFGINGKDEKTVDRYLAGELEHISQGIYDDFARISLDGIRLGEIISDSCNSFFKENHLDGATLSDHPEVLEPLLASQVQSLLSMLDSRPCGGVFVLLDATVQPRGEWAASSKAGIFIKKTQPISAQPITGKKHYLRGPAQIARDNGIELLGQWRMEYDIDGEDFFLQVMDTARNNPSLPLSRLYFWTGRVTLKSNSESGFLLCVPLRDPGGTVFGVCGIEVSDRMFKQLYCPAAGVYENVFSLAAPREGDVLCAPLGMIAGNYYLTGNRMTENLKCAQEGQFQLFTGESGIYGGKLSQLRLYPSDSPYASREWSVAVMMPKQMLAAAASGNAQYLVAIVCILLIISLASSVLVSRRYLQPVTQALDSIRTNRYGEEKESNYAEIADLLDYLGEKDKEFEMQRSHLEQRQQEAQKQAAAAKTELLHLADKRRKEVDGEAYRHFLSSLKSLTPKEKEVFGLYMEGKTAKEITEILCFSDNALKYHNKNIYDKLGVSSRKELLMYATLMKQEKQPRA